jgi:Cd2+/Zn2+-exporting ATPase/Cu+-exporting ATPase
VRVAASQRGIQLLETNNFRAVPGQGVHASINNFEVEVGNFRVLKDGRIPEESQPLLAQGKTLLYIIVNGDVAGIIAAEDVLRPEVVFALKEIRRSGITTIELLTGDNEKTAFNIADQLGIQYRANLLPENKIQIVKEYQNQGRTVVMVGDGVNDAPALAQANVGIAMGATGSDIAIEAAHIALMNDDWMQLPRLFEISRRTMDVIKINLGFALLYNVVGISLAAFGFLPPVLAAAAQSLPDIGILGNSSRLLRQK